MTQGEPEANTPSSLQVAYALTEVALELGGAWVIEISSDGQMSLRELPKEAPLTTS